MQIDPQVYSQIQKGPPSPGRGGGGRKFKYRRGRWGRASGERIGVSSRRVAPTPRQRPPCVRWAVSRPGRQLSRRTRWNLDPPRCRAVEAPPHATRTKSKANPAVRIHVGRRSLRGWAVFSCSGVGCFGAPLICIAIATWLSVCGPTAYVLLVLHARRGVVDPASLVCGRARGDE